MNHIFHPTDFSEASEIAFAHALKLALSMNAKISLMHVAENGEHADWHDFPQVRNTLERWQLLGKGSDKADLKALGIDALKVFGDKHDPVQSVLHFLHDHHASLIVLATHQFDGRARWMHRGVAGPIARHSHEPTLFVPHGIDGFVSLHDGSVKLKNIVIPIDHHPHPQLAVDAAARMAGKLECEEVTFTLLYVGLSENPPQVFPVEKEGWTWKKVTLDVPVVDTILWTVNQVAADLIVMTTAGHHGFLDALRGSTTELVLRHAPCPLLAVPHHGPDERTNG